MFIENNNFFFYQVSLMKFFYYPHGAFGLEMLRKQNRIYKAIMNNNDLFLILTHEVQSPAKGIKFIAQFFEQWCHMIIEFELGIDPHPQQFYRFNFTH